MFVPVVKNTVTAQILLVNVVV